MDTRQKILTFDESHAFLRSDELIVIMGLFDPLTLVQAQRIAAAAGEGRKVLAVVLTGEDTLLPDRARAALIAGLRAVDAVVLADAEQAKALREWPSEDLNSERERSAEFVEFVLRRQRSAAVPSVAAK